MIESKEAFHYFVELNKDKLVVVFFTATWCGPCKMIAPKVEEMAAEFPRVVCGTVDIDVADDVAAEWKVSCMPTFFFIKNGDKVEQMVGADADKLRGLMYKHQRPW
ncbi:PREDICTED: thioredoxin-like [Branchiostoma belcheri]|uniref:Thioredoxin-like n=1 Tax=Branchiostoma belcheri TaxID=7741 RepID=A0A6P5A4M4_BRABE|nr:PREDICTED: thioredoxin-like [Branchiostoma belcheri]